MSGREDWSKATSEELAHAVVAKDPHAWAELYLLWTPRIYGYFRVRMASDLDSVDDLTQETMIGVWQTLQSATRPPRQFRPWIFRIAHNKFVAYVKKRRADRTVVGLVDEQFRPADVTVGALREAQMRADWAWFVDLLGDAVDSMPVRYRDVLRTHLATEATGADLAMLLGLSTNEATRWRSTGVRLLHDTVAVTIMARGRSGRPCRRFRALLTEAGWRSGPLGESLRDVLVNHVGQCRRCQDHRDRLKNTLQLLPVFVPILVPAAVYARIADGTDRRSPRRQVVTAMAPVALLRQEPKRPSFVTRALDGVHRVLTYVFTGILLVTWGPPVLDWIGDQVGGTGGGRPATLRMWVTPGGHVVRVSPGGLLCAPATAADTCRFPMPAGTTVTLTAVPNPADPFNPPASLTWLGCPSGTDLIDPCTVEVDGDSAVCVVSRSSPWTEQDCRERASG